MTDTRDPSDARAADVSRRHFLTSSVAGVGAAALYSSPLTAAARVAATVSSSPIRVWQTTGAERHVTRPDLSWRAGATRSANDIVLDPQRKKQEVLGFGGAFTDAATYMFN